MQRAASYLVGEHDFKSFCTAKPEVTNTVRTVYSLDLKREDDMITLRIRGNGFLYNMVRIITGTLTVWAAVFWSRRIFRRSWKQKTGERQERRPARKD